MELHLDYVDGMIKDKEAARVKIAIAKAEEGKVEENLTNPRKSFLIFWSIARVVYVMNLAFEYWESIL